MSTPPNTPSPGPADDGPRKRRRSNRDRPRGPRRKKAGPNAPETQGQAPESPASSSAPPPASDLPQTTASSTGPEASQGSFEGQGRPNRERKSSGSRNKSRSRSRKPSGDRGQTAQAGSTPEQDGRAGVPSRGTNGPPNAGQADGGQPRGPGKKKKKVRTKTCFNCFTPCASLFRVQVDPSQKWKFVCDICWDHVAVGNPHYRYGGTWPPARSKKPGGGGGKRNHAP